MTINEIMNKGNATRCCLYSVLRVGQCFRHPGEVKYIGDEAPIYEKRTSDWSKNLTTGEFVEMAEGETVFPIEGKARR